MEQSFSSNKQFQISGRRPSKHAATSAFLRGITVAIPAFVCACSNVGTTSIDLGRTPYNDVIQDTSRQQALLNMIRVANHESPLFMDITEVDAATTLGATILGGPSGIGSLANTRSTSAGTIAGPVGFITGGAQYQEAPTIRYQPLSGQPLIAQLSTPLTPENLASLYGTRWEFLAVLNLAVYRITPGYSEYDPAINAIADLDQYGAITVAATSSQEVKPSATSTNVTIGYNQPAAKDVLTIYFEPNNIAVSHAQCDLNEYGRTGPDQEQKAHAEKIVRTLWARLQDIYHVSGNVINLTSKGTSSRPPLLSSRSALGVLQYAAEGADTSLRSLTAILPPESVEGIIQEYHERAKFRDCADGFYTLDPTTWGFTKKLQGTSESANTEDDNRYLAIHKRLDYKSSTFTMYPDSPVQSFNALKTEAYLANARKFVLVAVSDDAPSDAFVSVKHNGKWYFILNNDDISKSNLALITQITTVQAIPSQSPPLTPTISVGARQ